MKKVMSGLLLAGLMLSSAPAQAQPEIKLGGFMEITPFYENAQFRSNRSTANPNKNINVGQRFSLRMQVIASERVFGLIELRADQVWGEANSGSPSYSRAGDIGGSDVGVYVRNAFVEFMIPNTETARIRMGIQPYILPGFVAGSAILDTRVAGAVAGMQFSDTFGGSLFWLRPYKDDSMNNSTTDLIGITLPITGHGYSLTPWGAYGFTGRNSPMRDDGGLSTNDWIDPSTVLAKKNANIWWAGLTGELRLLDPWRMAFDFNYGSVDGYGKSLDRKGWLAAALVEYRTNYGTPGLVGWYSSGDKGNINNGSDRMPTLMPNWAASSFGYNGNFTSRSNGTGVMGDGPAGTWGVMLQMLGIHTLDKMSHNIRVGYYRGTNKAEAVRMGLASPGTRRTLYNEGGNGFYLSTKDNMWEVNFDTFYQLYNNLELALELGYLRLKVDKNLWQITDYKENGYRAALSFAYRF